MTKETLYMVAEVGYEYNDEVYHQPESGGITPVALYRDKTKAEAIAARKTLDYVKNEELAYYGYGLDDIMIDRARNKEARRAFEDLINKYDPQFVFDDTDYECLQTVSELVKKMSDNDIIELLSYTSLQFFEVVEVVLED